MSLPFTASAAMLRREKIPEALRERAKTCTYCRRVVEELMLSEAPKEEILTLGLVALSRVIEEQTAQLVDRKMHEPPPLIIVTTREELDRIRKEVPSA